MEQRTLESVIYEREPPIARIILNKADKANTKDAQLVQEVDACLHEADRDKDIKVVILKANGKGFCGGHVARWGPDENPYPDFGDTFEDLYKGTADLFLWPTLYLWEFPKPTISQIHGYCMGGGIYLGLLTDFSVASEDAYFQMPLAQSLGEPGGHTMIEPWLMMNWHRTMDWLLLAPTLSAQEALDWGLLVAAVMADQRIAVAVIGQRQVTVLARRDVAAAGAMDVCGIAAAVEHEHDLPTGGELVAHRLFELGAQGVGAAGRAVVAQVDQLDVGQRAVEDALRQV